MTKEIMKIAAQKGLKREIKRQKIKVSQQTAPGIISKIR
jgi:hypothetical protein